MPLRYLQMLSSAKLANANAEKGRYFVMLISKYAFPDKKTNGKNSYTERKNGNVVVIVRFCQVPRRLRAARTKGRHY